MSDQLKINCFIPIEIKARELNSKLLLAKKLIENGYRVYIGEKSIIDRFIKLSKIKKNGIYFYKSGSFEKKKELIVRSCEGIVVLDEEMGVAVKELANDYLDRTISYDVIDKYFVLGDKHRKAVIGVRPELESKIVVSGWPRIDLWRSELKHLYQNEIDDIKMKHGEFMLFSSDFGYTSLDRIEFEVRQAQKKGWQDKKIHEFKNNALNELQEYKKFVNFIKEYSECANLPKIIVRPHPAENHGPWLVDVKNFKNIKVVYEGEITPWVYASLGVIHRGCTTGVQAYISNINSYCWIGGGEYKKKDLLPYKVSHKFSDLKEFIKISNIALAEQSENYKCLNGEELEIKYGKLAVDVIVDELDKLGIGEEKSIKLNAIKRKYLSLSQWIYRMRYQKNILVDASRRSRYINKFGSPIVVGEINKVINTFQSECGISIEELEGGIFKLMKN